MRSTKDQLVEKGRSYACETTNVFPVEPSGCRRDSPLVSMEMTRSRDKAYSQAGRCGMQPKAKHSSRAGAANAELKLVKTETLEKNLELGEKGERERCGAGVTF
ncbi:hypothetical protein TNCV_3543671 [Trichonephila clavipes]|nr:hypothetical protein TNCV_3543671 [Trichonephila clavipes]